MYRCTWSPALLSDEFTQVRCTANQLDAFGRQPTRWIRCQLNDALLDKSRYATCLAADGVQAGYGATVFGHRDLLASLHPFKKATQLVLEVSDTNSGR